MVIAFLVVRKRFSGKEVLDFASNLGGAVPGTILGIGFVLAFSTSRRGRWWSSCTPCWLLLATGLLCPTWTSPPGGAGRSAPLAGWGCALLDDPPRRDGPGLPAGGVVHRCWGSTSWLVRRQKVTGRRLLLFGRVRLPSAT